MGCEPSGGGRISSAPIHRAALISRPRLASVGEIQVEKMVRRHYFLELLLLRVRGLANGLRGFEVQTSTCQPAAMFFSGACMLAGRIDRQTGVREVVGVARRSGTGGARRKYLWLGVAICWNWSKIRGPSGGSAGGEMQSVSHSRCAEVFACGMSVKSAAARVSFRGVVGGMSWFYMLG